MSLKENPLVVLVEECIRLRDKAQKVLSEAMEGEHLTRLEGLVLVLITEAGEALTISQVGRDLGHPRQVVQRAVIRLVELGMLRKRANPDHKTSALLEPTEKGRRYERQINAVFNDLVGTLLTDSDIRKCRRSSEDLKQIRMKIEAHES